MQQTRQMIDRLARSQAPVHISGESGSGKEMAARLMHMMGPRRDAPFVPVNCGAIPENLMESEFFGYRKGAFTGADQDKEGFFQAASGGTLFLDEVADLPACNPGKESAQSRCHRRGKCRCAHYQCDPSSSRRRRT
jgi:two-component system response regulator PilR (NtrC family)